MKCAIRKGERLLIRTGNSGRKAGKFVKDFVSLSEDAAAYLARKELRCLGVDTFSPGRYEAPMKVHKILMDAGVWPGSV